jgi:hypothetical protein
MNDQSLEQLLYNTALRSDMSMKYACLIQFRNKIIATGYNYYDTQKCCLHQHCILRG